MSPATPSRPEAARSGERGRLAALLDPVDAASLATFRLLFGGLMLWDTLDALARGRVSYAYLRPRFLFTYDLFPFVAPWPGKLLYLHYAVMALAAAGLMLGLFYRLAAVLFFLCYGYVFLLDSALYNNHEYLILLLAFLLCVGDADRWASLDARRRSGSAVPPAAIPFWQLLLPRLQIVLVFFWAGIAKLNPDWLAGEPMRTWLAQRASTPILGPWLDTAAAAYAFSYAGLLFDLAAGPLLLWRRTRPAALVALVAFNLLNHWLFEIGVFPFLMLAAAVLFVEPDLPRRLLGDRSRVEDRALAGSRRGALVFVAVYLAVQILLPLRPRFYAGNVGWTEEGQRFAWLMKLRSKSGHAVFRVRDAATGEPIAVDPAEELNAEQIRRMTFMPDMLAQYAHHVRAELLSRGVASPEVRVETWVSLNRRMPQRLVDPTVDLGSVVTTPFSAASWIVPLDESSPPGVLSLADYAALLEVDPPAGRRAE